MIILRILKNIFFKLVMLSLSLISSPLFAQTSLNAGGVGGGAIVVGASTNTCDGSMLGGLRWSAANTCMEVCNGTTWGCSQLSACLTNLPTGLSFTNQASVAVSTIISSNIVQAIGITGCTVEVSVTGAGAPEYRVCNNATCTVTTQDWTSGKSTFINNQYVQMRLTSSASAGVTFRSVLTVGASSAGWTVSTTVVCTDPNPPLGTFCADGTVYVGLSPDGGVKMYTTPCNDGRSWDGTACTGTQSSIRWSATATVATGITNSTTGEANTSTLAGLSNADSPYGPAVACQNLVFGGQSDWYLPSTGEATILQAACGVTPDNGCTSGYHHTSRESNTTDFFAWRSNSGNINAFNKTGNYPFRCVRKD